MGENIIDRSLLDGCCVGICAQELGAAKTPEQMWSISAKFCQRAAENYTHEYGTIARLAGDCVITGVSAAEQALPPGRDAWSPLSKAA